MDLDMARISRLAPKRLRLKQAAGQYPARKHNTRKPSQLQNWYNKNASFLLAEFREQLLLPGTLVASGCIGQTLGQRWKDIIYIPKKRSSPQRFIDRRLVKCWCHYVAPWALVHTKKGHTLILGAKCALEACHFCLHTIILLCLSFNAGTRKLPSSLSLTFLTREISAGSKVKRNTHENQLWKTRH